MIFDIIDTKEAFKKYCFGEISTSVCAKLYHRKLWNKLRFPSGEIYEDFAILTELIFHAETISFSTIQNYYYRPREMSIMRTNISDANLVILNQCKKNEEYVKDKHLELLEYLRYGNFRNLMAIYKLADEHYKKIIFSTLKEYRVSVIKIQSNHYGLKAYAYFTYFGNFLFSKIEPS